MLSALIGWQTIAVSYEKLNKIDIVMGKGEPNFMLPMLTTKNL